MCLEVVESWDDYIDGVAVDPLVRGLLACLPPRGTEWPQKQREAWLKLVDAALPLRYADEPAALAAMPHIRILNRAGKLGCEARWRPTYTTGADFRERRRTTWVPA